MTVIANTEMAAAWDGDEGDDWARDWQRYDLGVRAYHRRLLDAAAVAKGERVLDIGCGTGETTRAAAVASGDGIAQGVDLSVRMLERARELAAAEGIVNVTFERADAQVHPFAAGAYDVAISRFGAMFFNDPVAAFTNIGAGLRPGGRLVMVAWRAPADNEWLHCVFAALAVGRKLPVPPIGAPGPFGQADPGAVRSTLLAAGCGEIEITPLDEPFWIGHDGEDAFAWFRSTGIVRGMTRGLDETGRARALAALRQTMIDHDTGDGVIFGSGGWLISATKAAR